MPEERNWDGGWEGHRRAQLRRWAEWTFIDKLAWLERAHEMVKNLEHSRSPDPKHPARGKEKPGHDR